jgi:RHS repeat-associated protein
VGQIKNISSAFMTDGISRSQGTLNSWFSARSNRRGQITNTVYDIGNSLLNAQLTPANLRNRVAYTQYTDTATNSSYNQATLYSYDIHGNVDTLLQDYGNSSVVALQNVMNRNANNRWKKIVYGYDLISGKVNWVAYNPKKIDEFFHRYYYDAENRLTTVETSADSLVWERDARYEYYKHGPLARSVIGQQLVQGMDYAYTLQGWLKGVNSAGGSPLGGGGDMGEDGKSNGQNKYIARDAFGYHLNYFTGDYSNINSAYTPFPDHVYKPNGTARLTSAEYRPLYNGNISSMMVNIAALNEPVLHNYRYDQLNRLTGMNTYSGFRFQTNDWGTASDTLPLLRRDATTGDGAYKERIAYDANGNILKYLRKGRYGDTPMDSLTYNYTYNAQGQLQHNMLNFVRDRVNNTSPYANASRDDLEDQATGNYSYDEIGNLVKDNKESITNIKWSVYGKILEITRTATAENTTTNTSANDVVKINYSYDAAGNRISKRVQKSTGRTFYTWYARDAQGNVMATYTVDTASITVTPSTNLQNYDVHLYGSSRLGTLYRGIGATTNYTPPENLFFERGNKQYEMTNHLGNVLATISDRKKGYDTTGDGQVDYFLADTRQATDYHPFGWGMIGRSGTYNLFGYKYGFNGQENDKETTTQDYGMRIYDPRVGRFLSTDPLTSKYPFYTPYQYAGNKPIRFIDRDGAEEWNSRYDPSQDPFFLMDIWDNAVSGLGNILLRAHEWGMLDKHEGIEVAIVLAKTGYEIPKGITFKQLGSAFKIIHENRTFSVVPEQGLFSDVSDVGLGLLNVLSVLPMKGGPMVFAMKINPIVASSIGDILKALKRSSAIKQRASEISNTFQDITQGVGKKLRPLEAESGAILESSTDIRLRSIRGNEVGDYAVESGTINNLSAAGKTIDQVGVPAGVRYDIKKVLNQITRHLWEKPGVDFVLIDARNLNSADKIKVTEYVNKTHAQDANRILTIGLK